MRLFLIFIFSLFSAKARPCSVFFVSGSDDVVVAKNLDWDSGRGLIFINKRHVQKRAVFVGRQPPAVWTSKYMSATLTETGREFPWEGMNEAGLSVNILELAQSQAPPADDPRPALEMEQWVQYILDTSATLPEAIENADKITIHGPLMVHYFICDANSQCGVFEYINGALVIHSGDTLPYPALTNDTYEHSMSYFSDELKKSAPASILQTGNSRSLSRFSRAALWSHGYVMGTSALDYAFAGLDNLAQKNGLLRTYWRMAFVLKSRTLNWSTVAAPMMKSIRLLAFNPSCGAGTPWLDVNRRGAGDMNAGFSLKDSTVVTRELIQQSRRLSAKAKRIIADYPSAQTRCVEAASDPKK